MEFIPTHTMNGRTSVYTLYFHLNDQKFNYADGLTDIVILRKLICYVMQYNWNLCLMYTLFCLCCIVLGENVSKSITGQL